MKEGDNLSFATDDENERALWVQAVYRATGQTHKPVPPMVQTNKISNTQISRMQGGKDGEWCSREIIYVYDFASSIFNMVPRSFNFFHAQLNCA